MFGRLKLQFGYRISCLIIHSYFEHHAYEALPDHFQLKVTEIASEKFIYLTNLSLHEARVVVAAIEKWKLENDALFFFQLSFRILRYYHRNFLLYLINMRDLVHDLVYFSTCSKSLTISIQLVRDQIILIFVKVLAFFLLFRCDEFWDLIDIFLRLAILYFFLLLNILSLIFFE